MRDFGGLFLIHFKKITLKDIPLISEYLSFSDYGVCDYTAPTVYMWRDYFDTEFAVCKNTLFLRHNNFSGRTAYLFPIGQDKTEALELLSETVGKNVTFCIVPESEKQFLTDFYEKKFGQLNIRTENDIGWNDYIYLPEKTIGFPGKKLHGQKNHFNFFNKTYPDCVYTVIDSENAARVRDFVKELGLSESADDIERAEYYGVLEFLENYSDFPMSCGGFLELDGKIVAATVAERQGEYLIIHIEKADKNFRGAYQKIFHELLCHEGCDGIRFVNREEDCGDEGMRYAKNAYHPEKLLKKYIISFS